MNMISNKNAKAFFKDSKIKVLGVTGLSCSGKSTLIKQLAKDSKIINVDLLGHEALEIKKEDLIKVFDDILTDDKIDRKKLGDIVFNDDKELALLESITHPYIKNRIKKEIEQNKKVILDCAILFKMELQKYCDVILFLKTPYNIRLQRALLRFKHLSKKEIEARFKMQEIQYKIDYKYDKLYIIGDQNGTR